MIRRIAVAIAAALFLLALFGVTPLDTINEAEQVALGGLILAAAVLL